MWRQRYWEFWRPILILIFQINSHYQKQQTTIVLRTKSRRSARIYNTMQFCLNTHNKHPITACWLNTKWRSLNVDISHRSPGSKQQPNGTVLHNSRKGVQQDHLLHVVRRFVVCLRCLSLLGGGVDIHLYLRCWHTLVAVLQPLKYAIP